MSEYRAVEFFWGSLYTYFMNESFPEKKPVVPIEHAFEIKRKERSKEELALMDDLERLIPLLFEAENELIVARRYIREKQLQYGFADNAPHAPESKPDEPMREHIETLIDEVTSIKAEMEALLERMRILEDDQKDLIDREQHFRKDI